MAQLKDFQTGAVGDSFNGPIGTSTAAAGAFTTLSASSTLAVTGVATLTAQPILSSLTASRAVFTDASKGLVSNAITGTGNVVMSTSPTLVTPVLGAATGTSFQGIIGNVTPAAGNFTTLGASSTATLNTLASSGATLTGGTINGMTVGATTASSGAFTTLSAGNGISYFNNLDANIMLRVGVGITSTLGTGEGLEFSFTAPTAKILSYNRATSAYKNIFIDALTQTFGISGTTQLTLNSTTLYTASGINVGIGTSSPQARLQVLDQIKVSSADQSSGNVILGDGSSTAFNVGIGRWNGSTNAAGAGGVGYFSQALGNSGGHYFYTGDAAAGSQTERARIPPAGGFQSVTTISVGNATPSASGAGITFPATQSASSDANTLDDYEEGTWTPVFIAQTGTLGTVTYENRNATYTKIGNTVFITCTFYTSAFAAGTGTGDLLIGGLPFTTASGNNGGGLSMSDVRLWTLYNPSGIRVNVSSTTCLPYYRTTANGPINNIQVSDAGTTNPSNVVTFGGFYTVA
jgi:hypothetical protein